MENLLARFTCDELETLAETGKWPESMLCASFAERPSELDGLDRKTLLKRWEEDERFLAGRSEDELKYYVEHGYWPEATEEDKKFRLP